MADISLESLGLNESAIADKLVDRLVEHFVERVEYDPDSGRIYGAGELGKRLDKMIAERIDQRIEEIGEKHIVPQIAARIENLVLQQTTHWGEKKGPPQSFIEYALARVDHFITEDVDKNGKPKREGRRYDWEKKGSRIDYIAGKLLDDSISAAVSKALSDANSAIATGMKQALTAKIDEVRARLSLEAAE